MKNLKTAAFSFFISILIISSCSTIKNDTSQNTKKYSPVSKELYNEIAHMDSMLFDAFNNRNLEQQKIIFSPDTEFYHDKGGLANYNQTIENLRKLFEQNKGLVRTLVPGSLEVYPIKDYGAIQIGVHQFCHIENGKNDCGTFKFVHIWQKKEGAWKLTRVVSYDH